jgi:cardiolipin synthase
MPLVKRLADGLTLSRLVVAMALLWLGLQHGASALPAAGALMILSWASDVVDGGLARRSPIRVHTWIGDHDLEIDMSVSLGLLGYLLASGFVDARMGAGYVLAWGLVFWRWGIQRGPGMLFQAPIYGWFILVALRNAPPAGWAMVVWILCVLVVTWPRFPQEVIPGFLVEMRRLGGRPG